MRNPKEYYNTHSRGYVQKWDLSQEGLKRPRNYYRLKTIESLIKLPVHYQQEFLTSAEASRNTDKSSLDASAAALILQAWIDKSRNI